MRRWLIPLYACVLLGQVQPGKQAYEKFHRWRGSLGWDQAVSRYRAKLSEGGLDKAAIERTMRAIDSYGEAELYDKVFTDPPDFNTRPNSLLVEVVRDLRPGEALDIAMGQGRNSIYLASLRWTVTGFDVSQAGLAKAREAAAAKRLNITAVHSSDEDFDFGRSRWDLIAIIYSLEKRSTERARDALKPGGIVVIEAGHKSASGAPFEYDSGELRRMFAGFEILRDDELTAQPDWSKAPIRLVRFVARKPR
jgi:SAM-dependent methyltransferase